MPTVEINRDNTTLTLRTALLIYTDRAGPSSEEVVVTQHPVEQGAIQPGSPLDLTAFRKLLDAGPSAGSASASDYAFQFPRLIAESPERIVWWSPSGIKTVFIGGEDSKQPKARRAWIPQLIWCASRQHHQCYLWACHDTDSPGPHTSVYRPQFGPADMNHIHSNSAICVGTTKIDSHTPEAWEKGFWSSRFKVAGNLKSTKPYEIQEKFQALGTLASVLPRRGATY